MLSMRQHCLLPVLLDISGVNVEKDERALNNADQTGDHLIVYHPGHICNTNL